MHTLRIAVLNIASLECFFKLMLMVFRGDVLLCILIGRFPIVIGVFLSIQVFFKGFPPVLFIFIQVEAIGVHVVPI